jgi:site-specific recombinase XerD
MKIQDALARFLVQMKADGRSDHTMGQYRRHVTAFADWLAHERRSSTIADLGHEDVAAFLAAPVARTAAHGGRKAPITLNAMRTSLRIFFRYAHEASWVAENPARLVRRALCSPPPPRGLPDADRDRLLATMADADGTAAARDHALFHLLAATGIRIGSAVALRVEDVDLDRGEVRLGEMKGERPDVVYLGDEIRDHLRRFIGDLTTGSLFAGRGSNPVTTRHAQRRMRFWLSRADVRTKASPHAFRHALAMRIYKRTGDLALVQAALCHRSIASTLVYARVDAGRVRAALG